MADLRWSNEKDVAELVAGLRAIGGNTTARLPGGTLTLGALMVRAADEIERLRKVIMVGGAMYRAERAMMGIPGGDDPKGQPIGLRPGEPEEWADRPTPEDAAIKAAFPTRSGRDDLYAEAMRLVGDRHSKGALVALVVWLLLRIETGGRDGG